MYYCLFLITWIVVTKYYYLSATSYFIPTIRDNILLTYCIIPAMRYIVVITFYIIALIYYMIITMNYHLLLKKYPVAVICYPVSLIDIFLQGHERAARSTAHLLAFML